MPSIAPLLDKARPDEERRIAMCIIDDMLEHSAQGRAKYLAQVRRPWVLGEGCLEVECVCGVCVCGRGT